MGGLPLRGMDYLRQSDRHFAGSTMHSQCLQRAALPHAGLDGVHRVYTVGYGSRTGRNCQ